MRLFTLLLALLAATPVAAQIDSGTCAPGTAERSLDAGGVQALLRTNGSLFFNEADGGFYTVPDLAPLYTAGLWVGGLVDGELRTAAARYRDFEFWPGPLRATGQLPDEDCSGFDRIWVVSRQDIEDFETGRPLSQLPDLRDWPAELGAPVLAAPDNGLDDDDDGLTDEGRDGVDNDGDGETDEFDEQELITCFDQDGDGLGDLSLTGGSCYDLAAGDRPVVFGSQTAFWVMNDVGNEHDETETEPMGLEVRVMAFAIATDEAALHQATFYRYQLVYKGNDPLTDAYVSFFLDPDIGDSDDDYVGSDSTRALAFAYNAAETDAVYGLPPSVGVDFFTGADGAMYFNNSANSVLGGPDVGVEYHNVMRSLWTGGTPLTARGDGYKDDGPVTTWAFPGDPEAEAFWSEVNNNGIGSTNTPSDRRLVLSAGPLTLNPVDTYTLDLGLLFAFGSGHLNSVTALKAASDGVQARYDAGTLFAAQPYPPPPAPGSLAAPDLTAPATGTAFIDEPAILAWTAVPGATLYRVEIDTDPTFATPEVRYAAEPTASFEGPVNEISEYTWRVKALAGVEESAFSTTRRFVFYRYAPDGFASGVGIIEVATPAGDPCADAGDDPGCASGYPGNTVWLDPSSVGDYVLTNSGNDFGDLVRYPEAIGDDDFEMRFTEACAGGACLGIYADAAPGGGADEIASVPFELWNAGNEGGAEDDVRMIPILRATEGNEPVPSWADAYTATQQVVAGRDTLSLPVTERVLWMMPDRPNGYQLFADEARLFGGPGALYDPDNDGDFQEDLYTDPETGDQFPCLRQGYYIDFCYQNASIQLVAPIGHLDGMQFADLAGDGSTPPVGTVIRFDAADRLTVSAEGDAPAQPARFALGTAYPNPFGSAATVPFEIGRAGQVRLAVYDVLGREVAVLIDRELTAGAHRARIDGARLASGIYLVVLEAGGRRQTQKVMLVR